MMFFVFPQLSSTISNSSFSWLCTCFHGTHTKGVRCRAFAHVTEVIWLRFCLLFVTSRFSHMMRHCLRDFICQYCVFIAIAFYCVSNGLFVNFLNTNWPYVVFFTWFFPCFCVCPSLLRGMSKCPSKILRPASTARASDPNVLDHSPPHTQPHTCKHNHPPCALIACAVSHHTYPCFCETWHS